MSKLETQINQIFFSPTESRKLSLILFEEKIAPNLHLFLLAELRDIQKKTEINDLSKISELIIDSFRSHKKLTGDAMFENVLAEINNSLGDFAHKGRKSWLGKFSALIALKADRDFYLANTGYTCAWMKRKNTLNEIVPSEKTQTHPLKTFQNFSSGKLADGDNLILATSSIFNYISVELFSRTLNSSSLEEASSKISSILQDSAKSDEGFAVFMLNLSKKQQEIPVPAPTKAKSSASSIKGKAVPVAASIDAVPPIRDYPIYAPLPEDMPEDDSQSEAPKSMTRFLPPLPKLAGLKFKLPSINFGFNPKKFNFLPNVSGPAKFFFISFILFAVLFAMNIAAFGIRKQKSKNQEKFNATAEALVNFLTEAESSLLYKNQSQAMKLMTSAETELHKLQQLDAAKSAAFEAKFEEMNNKINRVTVLRNLSPVFSLDYPVSMIARAGDGYLIASENPNSLGTINGNELKNLFMLNKTDGDMRGIAHVSGLGNYVASSNKIYLANGTSKEFEQQSYISGADLNGLKFGDTNKVYSINRTSNQVIRATVSAKSISAPSNMLKANVNLNDAQDFAVDGDLYILFPDKLSKFTNGQPVEFVLAPMSEPAQHMTKVRIGSQIYILEPVANRIMIYSRKGDLLNQVKLPELSDMRDIYIDETSREMLILNNNKVYRITF